MAGEVKVRLVNEYRDYYWHYADGEGWKYEFNSQPYLEQEQTLQLDGKGPTTLSLPLAAGWYRLEVENSQGHQSSLRVEIGSYAWGGGGEQARPDKIAITLDKRAYQAGDKAKVTLVAPVRARGSCWWRMVTACAGGSVSSCEPKVVDWQRRVASSRSPSALSGSATICISLPRLPPLTANQSR